MKISALAGGHICIAVNGRELVFQKLKQLLLSCVVDKSKIMSIINFGVPPS